MVALTVVLAAGAAVPLAGRQQSDDRVVLVTLDGARWQEIFAGLDVDVLRDSAKGGRVVETAAYRRYWAPTPEERRQRLMPFLWSTLATRHGFLAGNRSAGSYVSVANRQRLSFPGYAELLTGATHDDVVKGNARTRYPVRTVLDWLPSALRGAPNDVAVFGSWSTFRWIVNGGSGGLVVNAGFDRVRTTDPLLRQLSAHQFDTYTPWTRARPDHFTVAFGLAHFRRAHPRVMYLALNDADEAAHAGRYEDTLDALHAADGWLASLWAEITPPADALARTTLIVTVDHGRGRTPTDWRDHGAEVPGSDEAWLGCFGPGVTARGELRQHLPIQQRQVAATVAAAVGQDFREAYPEAAPAVEACLGDHAADKTRRALAPTGR